MSVSPWTLSVKPHFTDNSQAVTLFTGELSSDPQVPVLKTSLQSLCSEGVLSVNHSYYRELLKRSVLEIKIGQTELVLSCYTAVLSLIYQLS